MKIFCFVDVHGNKSALKKVVERADKDNIDIVVCAGDLTMFGNKLEEILKSLSKLKKPVLIIPGNHEDNEVLEKACTKFEVCIDIHRKGFRADNYFFIGYGEGGFSMVDKGFERTMKILKKKIKKEHKVILVTHAPPYRTKLDKINGNYCGNKSIRNFISEVKPVLAVSGHLHENAGKQDKIGKSLVINPGFKGVVVEI